MDVNQLLPLVPLAGVILGVVFSVYTGYQNRPEGENFKKGRLISSLIIGTLGAVSLSSLAIGQVLAQIGDVGIVALFVASVFQGFGVDKGLSRLDK